MSGDQAAPQLRELVDRMTGPERERVAEYLSRHGAAPPREVLQVCRSILRSRSAHPDDPPQPVIRAPAGVR
ncbi:MAG: hypothetical protein F4X35_03095 [Alphaproteobacteria bacterium]|nr:hypothetical protein [Alphaproteobacteria bacterium]